jgi:hypothetical protein
MGELDGCVAHRAGTASDEHEATVESARAESVRSTFGGRETAMGGEKWHAEARAQVE